MHELISKQRILIVDDEPINIKLLANELKADYDVIFALNGKDALKILKAGDPVDLILLDIMMPGIDGYDVCKQLKTSPQTQNIPVIFITTMSQEEDETKGLEIGAVDYITKPFSMAIAKARVKTHIELKQHRDQLEKLSSMDGLTGIANRRRFDEALALEWKRAARHNTTLSLIMIDIDFFKIFNDSYGHLAGDECLKVVATTLACSTQRPSDLVARYGGEEFVALLPRTDKDGVHSIADGMREKVLALNIPNEKSEVLGVITISLGVVSAVSSHDERPSSLITAGDKALYEAKRNGRNQVVCYNPLAG